MLSLSQITLIRGHKVLLEKASVIIHEKQKMGLIGHNGCGKSSFLRFILGDLSADGGDYTINPHVRISHLSQQLPETDDEALPFVLAGDSEYLSLITRLHEAEKQQDDACILACHEKLSQTGGYSKPALAASIMSGLGFSAKEQKQSVNRFSGGWRMRLSLARCLIKPADLLLLDEPTNHLDMEAIFWLEKWLKLSPCSMLVISHDREFLDSFTTHILAIEQQQMLLYKGNYSTYERTRAEQLALQQSLQVKQQQKIDHLMAYVNRFKAQATKAKQAQSRLKQIANMEMVAKAHIDSPFSFTFLPFQRASSPLIHCEKVVIAYEDHEPILKNVNLSLNPGDRIALLGPNGQGKTSLIKTLTKALKPRSGTVNCGANLTIGYYAQHQLDDLDNRLSPLETIQKLSPTEREQTIRNFLGGFNFVGDMAINAIIHFSGGEKARLALAKLVWQKPNLLLLDEPTNHLDLDMRQALEIALQTYEGALLIISHDRHLLRHTIDTFYLVSDKHVRLFKGDLDDYHASLNEKNDNETSQLKTKTDYREQKTLQNRLKKLENDMKRLNEEQASIELTLADPLLYEPSQQTRLQSLLSKQKAQYQQITALEAEWISLAEQLESMGK